MISIFAGLIASSPNAQAAGLESWPAVQLEVVWNFGKESSLGVDLGARDLLVIAEGDEACATQLGPANRPATPSIGFGPELKFGVSTRGGIWFNAGGALMAAKTFEGIASFGLAQPLNAKGDAGWYGSLTAEAMSFAATARTAPSLGQPFSLGLGLDIPSVAFQRAWACASY